MALLHLILPALFVYEAAALALALEAVEENQDGVAKTPSSSPSSDRSSPQPPEETING